VSVRGAQVNAGLAAPPRGPLESRNAADSLLAGGATPRAGAISYDSFTGPDFRPSPVASLILFEIYRLALRALVVLMALHFITSAVEFLRRRRREAPEPSPLEPWPFVTVQLPVRDEYYTATRALEAIARLDYPRDRLEIQILDDSTDDTVELIHKKVVELLQSGFDVIQIRRFVPVGYKAGALANGLAQAKGELIALFDADFVPPSDFLERVVPHFSDPRVGMVQGRWAHLNRNESWFTRLQAQILDGLMVVEQTAKSAAGLPIQFNGTGGMWRKRAIDEAGGWTFDSLTEDLDLSLRAQLAGWRLVHLPDVAVPGELPRTLGLFRVQQRRWALGTAQLLRKRLSLVLGSSLPIAAKISVVMQLARHFSHPLLLLMVLTVPLTTFGIVQTPVDYGWANAAVFGLALGSVAFQHAVAAHAIGRSVLGTLALSPFVVALAIGLAPTYTVALAYGLRDRAGAFHRTPKITRKVRPGEPHYRAERSALTVFECLIGATYAWFTALAASRGFLLESSFCALITVSFLWMGLGSLSVAAESPQAPALESRVGRESVAER
jgi:cellulose synthase/poly-beta-1,6-N-acetylglucosamine synthase-like glycosyltransferase